MKDTRVLILQNIVAPYRTPLFEEIASRVSLRVVYLSHKPDDRKWAANLGTVGFQYKFLKKLKLVFFVANPGLPSYLFKHRADVYVLVDNEENLFSNLWTVAFAKLTGKPYVLWTGHIPITGSTIHPIDFHKTIFHKWPIKDMYLNMINWFNQLLYKSAMSYLAYSDYSKQYLLEAGVDARKIYVGTQAMSPGLLVQPPRETGKNTHAIGVLYFGYLRPEKGVDTLIQAFKELPRDKFELYIVGDGPEKESLQKLAAGARNIIFHPNVGAKGRASWYAAADIMVLPTFFDPWAHTVTESLFYGTPVVVSRSAAASTVIHPGLNGFITDAGDVQKLSHILRQLTAARIAEMKTFIRDADQSRLFDVSADADNFVEAISSAEIGVAE